MALLKSILKLVIHRGAFYYKSCVHGVYEGVMSRSQLPRTLSFITIFMWGVG